MDLRAWRRALLSDTAILIWMAVASVVIHCLVNGQYGFHRDELNFIEDGRHLAWGYIDCPPFTPFVAHIAEALFGTSLVGIRFFPAVSQGIVLVLTGLMVKRMGGSRWAQIIGAVGAAISGASLSQGSIFMYVSFDFLWWVVVAYSIISLLKTGDARWWLAVGAGIGLGMMTKLTMSYLAAGVATGVLLTPARRYLRSPWLWAGVALALVIFLPYLIWIVQHDFLPLEKLSVMHARDVRVGHYKMFLLDQLYSSANPSAIYLWVLGLVFFWRSRSGVVDYRPLLWMYAVPLVGFLITQGRGYYLAPAYPMLIAGGAYQLGERVRSLSPAQRSAQYGWLHYSLAIGGLAAASLSMPVVPLNSFWWKVADGMHQLYREEVGWPEMVKTVADIRDTVPVEDRARLGILTGNYGEAGAINVYGPQYGLPRAISGIDSFWLWGYGDPPPETVIVLGLEPAYAQSLFESCSLAAINQNPYGIENEESRDYPYIMLCRNLRQPWEQFWEGFQYYG